MSGLCVCERVCMVKKKHTFTKAFVSENTCIFEHGSLSVHDYTSIFLVSSWWEYIMVKEHVCQWEDKLKQDVLAPYSFEGVPHHTSDSVEGRSNTIKGHSVYINLPASACQMLQSFSFISSYKCYFLFLQQVCYFTFCTDGKQEKATFFCWTMGEAKFEHCLICLRKPAEIEGFRWSGRQGSQVSPSALLYWWRYWYHRDERLGPINMVPIKSSAFVHSPSTHVRLSLSKSLLF